MVPHGLQDFGLLTRGLTQAMGVEAPSLNHWTTRRFLGSLYF